MKIKKFNKYVILFYLCSCCLFAEIIHQYYTDGMIQSQLHDFSISKESNCIIRYHYPNNFIKDVNFHQFCQYKKSQVVKYYYPSGAVYKLIPWANGEINGVVQFYYENGNLLGEEAWKNNKLNGKVIYYYRNGKIKISANYKNDKPDGFCREYFPNGNLKVKSFWKLGNLIY